LVSIAGSYVHDAVAYEEPNGYQNYTTNKSSNQAYAGPHSKPYTSRRNQVAYQAAYACNWQSYEDAYPKGTYAKADNSTNLTHSQP
jgi:hypothetical protein